MFKQFAFEMIQFFKILSFRWAHPTIMSLERVVCQEYLV